MNFGAHLAQKGERKRAERYALSKEYNVKPKGNTLGCPKIEPDFFFELSGILGVWWTYT